jgi:hypothetical protein
MGNDRHNCLLQRLTQEENAFGLPPDALAWAGTGTKARQSAQPLKQEKAAPSPLSVEQPVININSKSAKGCFRSCQLLPSGTRSSYRLASKQLTSPWHLAIYWLNEKNRFCDLLFIFCGISLIRKW